MGVLLLLLIKPGRNRSKPNFPRFQGNISQEPLKLFSPFLFYCRQTIRKCKNTASVDLWILFAIEVLCEVVFESAIFTTSVSLTIKVPGHLTQLVSSVCVKIMKVLWKGDYLHLIFRHFWYAIHDRIHISFAHAFLDGWSKFPPEVFSER